MTDIQHLISLNVYYMKAFWSKGPHKGKGDEWSTGAELVHTGKSRAY